MTSPARADEEQRLPFTEHLRELRQRLFHSVIVIGALFIVAFIFHKQLFSILKWPIVSELKKAGLEGKILQLDFMELFWIHLKLSLVAAIFAGAPFLLFQIWKFIQPALYKNERRFAIPFIVSSTICFLGGAVFCYFAILPILAQFVIGLSQQDASVQLALRVDTVYSFPINLLFAFGICFELPVLLFFLTTVGLVTPKKLIGFYRYFIVVSLIVGAILTPPDPTSQIALAVPLNVLYWVGIGASLLARKRRNQRDDDAGETAER